MKAVRWLIVLGLSTLAAFADTWPTFHGDFSLSGYSKADVPTKPKLRWLYDAQSPVHAAPVADAYRLYVAMEKGDIHALNFKGKYLWSYAHSNETGSIRMAAPVTAYSFTPLRIRTIEGECREIREQSVIAAYVDGTIRAFDGMAGDPRWSQKIEGPIKSTPLVYRTTGPDATVIVMNQPSGSLHAFDLLTGAARWQQDGPERADGHLALSRDTLAFGSCAAALHTLPADGNTPFTSISLGEGAEVAGGVVLHDGHVYSGNRGGSIVAADLSAGSNVWINTDWSGELFTTPAVDGKHLVAVNGYGSVVCLDLATGKRLWINEAEATDAKAPVIAGNSVVASIDGTLVILGLSDGKERWRYEISDEITSPSIIEGMILVGTDEGQVLAFGE